MLLNTKFYDKENKREAQSMTVTTRNTALKTSIYTITQGPNWNICGICAIAGHGWTLFF